MKVISIVGAKGGTGKSTISLLLTSLISQKHSVALLDCDIQSTCVSAKLVNPELPFEVVSSPHLKELISQGKKLEKKGVEWIIIDTNPRSFLENPKHIEEIIKLSDLCLLPCRPAPRDIRANTDLASKIASKNPKARILWNFVQTRVNAHKESMKQAPDLLGLKPLKNFLKHRICYQDVFDEPPFPIGNSLATQELKQLFKEIKGLVK
jgi:cellulose biosynthesis protein BcsQ